MRNIKATNYRGETSMEIKPYARLVSLPVHAANVFHFPEGIPAFENIKQFAFICKPDTAPFLFMQSLVPGDIAFVCIDPFLVYKNYKPRISQADVNFLHLSNPEDALILAIVTVNKDMHKTTVNLQGPIVINMQASLGKQIVCEGRRYPVRYKIWDALEKGKTAIEEEKNKVKQSSEATYANA